MPARLHAAGCGLTPNEPRSHAVIEVFSNSKASSATTVSPSQLVAFAFGSPGSLVLVSLGGGVEELHASMPHEP
jgi:hypothetical protein